MRGRQESCSQLAAEKLFLDHGATAMERNRGVGKVLLTATNDGMTMEIENRNFTQQ
jgi:hypothetical protein